MKNAALLIALSGLILLSTILLFQKPVIVSDYNQLNSLEENTLISVHGNIINTNTYSEKYIILLDSNVSCIVDSIPTNKSNVHIIGLVQKYQGKSNILSLQIQNGN